MVNKDVVLVSATTYFAFFPLTYDIIRLASRHGFIETDIVTGRISKIDCLFVCLFVNVRSA